MEERVMFVLHVKVKMKAGQAAAAEEVFAGPFKAAITAQPGFRDVRLLRPSDHGDYVLSIAFENQPLQQQWVKTDLHGEVWSRMEENFEGYTVTTFNSI
jgi:heme-degrading monooxygenase HmoA